MSASEARGGNGLEPAGDMPGLLSAFRFSDDGRATAIGKLSDLSDDGDGWFWLHVNLADMRVRSWIATLPGIAKADLESLLSADDSLQLACDPASLRGTISDLVLAFEGKTDEFGFLRFLMTKRLVVSGRRQAMRSVEMIRRQIELGKHLEAPVDLLKAIVEEIAVGIDAIVDELAASIDAVEDALLKDRIDDERSRLGRVRLTTVRIHRRLNGLRALFRRLATDHSPFVADRLRDQAGHFVQRFDEIDHDVVELRDRARLLQDEIAVKLAEKTNRNLHVLSIVTTLLLPPTLVTGLFGMNVQGLPFAENPAGFWLVGGLALGVVVIAAWSLGALGMFTPRSKSSRKA